MIQNEAILCPRIKQFLISSLSVSPFSVAVHLKIDIIVKNKKNNKKNKQTKKRE